MSDDILEKYGIKKRETLGLKNKKALVTGASRGIGEAIAKTLASKGADVVVNYHSSDEKASETAQSLEIDGEESWVYPADVSDFEDVKRMKKSIEKNFGKIDILVNNAGINRDTLFKKMGLDKWDSVLQVNLGGVFNCTKQFIEHVKESDNGRIINISSIVGEMGNVGQVNYASSKAGVIGFTKSLARELARDNVTVNAVAPGFIETEMIKNIPDKVKDKILDQIPMSRFGKPEEIADVVAFLSSPMASYITGSVIDVNGGHYM